MTSVICEKCSRLLDYIDNYLINTIRFGLCDDCKKNKINEFKGEKNE